MRRLLGLFRVSVAVGLLVCGGCGKEENARARKQDGERKAAEHRPATAQIKNTMEKCTAFLRGTQHDDGGWGARGSDVGITGLVVVAIAEAPGDVRNKNADLIGKAVKYLLANRRDDGSIVNEDGQVANYRTSIAARALIALDREKHKGTIDAAVKYTKGIQGKDPNDKARFGSMGYGSDETKGDQINTEMAIELLAKAGVPEDDPVYKRALVFLGRTQNVDEYAEVGVKTSNDGGAIYRSVRGGEGASKAGTITLPDGTKVWKSYGGATYALLKSLLFAGLEKDNPRVQAAYQWICEHYTVKENPEMGEQGLYYFYYTMARTLELGGSPTIKKGDTQHNWAEELAAEIISRQNEDGSWVNSGNDRWWEADPTLASAYSMNALNICHGMLAK